jgi:hypothetical protein
MGAIQKGILSKIKDAIEYKLNLSATNSDTLIRSYSYNESNDTGITFPFWAILDLDTIDYTSDNVIISRPPDVATGNRFDISIQQNGDLRFRTRGTNYVTLVNFMGMYSGVRKVEARYTPTQNQILIDDVVVAFNTSVNRPSTCSSPVFVSGQNATNGAIEPSQNYINGSVHEFGIYNDHWKANEGSGFTLTAEDEITTIEGQTGNAAGLSYWDGFVWVIL